MSQNPTTDIPSGVLLIDKAQQMTSHDVVAIARRSLGIKKIGHCGTLDPMATGLLMLVVGRATKIQDLLMAEDKEYDGTLTLGVNTSSQDAMGDVESEKEVPALTEAQLTEVFDGFKGDFEQIPPMVSAIKKDGKRLYKLAREGKVVERAPRAVNISDYKISRVDLPEVDFTVCCSKGFYVRTYAFDIGEKIGCGGHLSALRRTRSGKFTLERAVTIDQLKNADREELLGSMVSLAEISVMRGA